MAEMIYAFEVYWPDEAGVLVHATVQIKANDEIEAERILWAQQPKPRISFPACSRDTYSDGYYDVEFLGEQVNNQER